MPRSHAVLLLKDKDYADRAVELLVEVAGRDLPSRPSARAEALAVVRPGL